MNTLDNGHNSIFDATARANIRIVVFAIAAIALMMFDHRTQHLAAARNALATTVYPLQYIAQLPIQFAHWSHTALTSRQQLQSEIKRLQQQQLFVNAQLQKLSALEAENRRLRLLLESSTSLRERVLIAELIEVDFDPYRHQILLNRGAHDGLQISQPILDQRGVVGQILHVNQFTATAVLITDPNHALPVQIDRNGLRTLARGTGNFQQIELPLLPNNNDIQIGDVLSTSGLGGRFPRGYPVATVTEVSNNPGQPFARILAKPIAQLDRIREVLLVTSSTASITPVPTPAPELTNFSAGDHAL